MASLSRALETTSPRHLLLKMAVALSPLYSPSLTQPLVLAPRWTTTTFSYPPQTSIPTFTSTSSSSSLPTPVAQTSSSIFVSLPTPSPTSTTNPSPGSSSEQSGKSLLVCSGIRENSEIAGLGIRISFYATSFLAVVAALLPRADIDGTFWILMLANLALLVSSIVQASIHNLSLYTAILISYLLILHLTSASTVLIIRASQGQKVHWRYTPFLVLQSILILALAIYVWSHAHTFGSQPECNPATQLIFFGHAFSTTGSGRVAPLVLLAFMLATVVAQVARSILNRSNRATAGYDELRNSPRRAGDYFVLTFWGTFFLARWLYIVVTVEQTIRRNFLIHDSHAFNFGQIFPLLTIGLPVIAVIYAYLPRQEATTNPSPAQAYCRNCNSLMALDNEKASA